MKQAEPPPDGLAASVRCPGCDRRATLREHQGVMDTFERWQVANWQCVYCGSVCEHGKRGLHVTHVDRIVLLPGELEAMRDRRAGR